MRHVLTGGRSLYAKSAKKSPAGSNVVLAGDFGWC